MASFEILETIKLLWYKACIAPLFTSLLTELFLVNWLRAVERSIRISLISFITAVHPILAISMSINYVKKDAIQVQAEMSKIFYFVWMQSQTQEIKGESHAGRCHCYLFPNVRTKIIAKHICNASLGNERGPLSVTLRGLWQKNVGCLSLSDFNNLNNTSQYLPQHETLVRQNVSQIELRPDVGAQNGCRDLAQVPAPRLLCLNLCLALTTFKDFLTNKLGNNSFAFIHTRSVSILCELSCLA